MIFVKFTLRIVAVISVASCLRQSSQPAAQTNGTDVVVDDETLVPAQQEAKLLPNFSLGSFIPPVSKITLPKLPIPKRNTVTLTSTILTQTTKHVAVYPTCLRLHNIKSVCNGRFETIQPTPSLSVVPQWKETDSDYDQELADRQAISPSLTQPIQSTEIEDSPRKNIIEPSEFEYEYMTSSSDDVTSSLAENVGGETRNVGNFIQKFFGPKYEIVTEYLTATKVKLYTDYANTATLVVVNCLPSGMRYPLCDLHHIQPLLQQLNLKTDRTAEIDQTVQKVYDHVDKFALSNPYGFLGISPDQRPDQVYGALNSDGIPSILRTADQFPALE